MRDITLCHPRLQALAARLVEESRKQGFKIKITETLRTKEEQDELFAKGRTKPGCIITNASGDSYSSYHQWGIAFDICRNDGSGAYNESGKFFERVGAIGVGLGLEWGGNWTSIVDKPHFQLPDWGSSTSGIKKYYRTPEEFMKTWHQEERIGWKQETDGWHFYLGNTGECVCNSWYQDTDEKWYWFDGSGIMVRNTWYQYQGDWFYLGSDGAMVKGLQTIDRKWYFMDEDGKMVVTPVTLSSDQDGAIKYPGLGE